MKQAIAFDFRGHRSRAKYCRFFSIGFACLCSCNSNGESRQSASPPGGNSELDSGNQFNATGGVTSISDGGTGNANTAVPDATATGGAGGPANDAGSCPKAQACTPGDCAVVAPTNALITDWQDVAPDGTFVDVDTFSAAPADWWQHFYGGPWVSPRAPLPCDLNQTLPEYYLTQDTSKGTWHVTGKVGLDWASMGLWFGPCKVDMSAFDGISFTISGNAGRSNQMTFAITTSPDSPPDACRTNVGTCLANCHDPQLSLDVAALRQTYTFWWSDLTGGSPLPNPKPSEITEMTWSFVHDYSGTIDAGAPFDVDVTIDDIILVNK